jgi:hypothetical protein
VRAFVVILGTALMRLVLKGTRLTHGMTIRAMSWPLTVLILGVMIVFLLIQACHMWARFA